MTTKNKLIIAISVFVIGLAGFLVGRAWLNKADKPEIEAFLQAFSNDLQSKPIDSTLIKFEVKQSRKDIFRILNLLANKTGVNGKSESLFKTTIDIENSDITIVNETLSRVKVPLKLTNSKFPDFPSSLNIELRKEGKNKFIITSFNGEELFTNFVAFENAIKTKMHSDDEIFSPQTLLAFKAAEQLKSRYDSVLWFAYVQEKPFYYVVKGDWEQYGNLNADGGKKTDYKMGLVNGDLKEIIPAEFDLIHNIGGTFPELIEVEKDGKKGFYDLQGRNVIPVINDQIIPVKDSVNIGVVSIGSDYFWLRKDYSISERDTSIKIAELLKTVDAFANSYTISSTNLDNLLEFNSREIHAGLYLPPSYLVDWKIFPMTQHFKNPLRQKIEYYDISSSVEVTYSKSSAPANWLQTAFYSIRDNYIGGRSDFYETNNVLLVDSKNNKVYGYRMYTDEQNSDNCNEFKSKALSETLFEIQSGGGSGTDIEGKYLSDMPFYHYLSIADGKLTELPNKRFFEFTKYVKMDDSYIKGCYVYGDNEISTLPKSILTYMKMEIYADYNYTFTNKKWDEQFKGVMADYDPINTNVDNKLTEIDQYNIKWINQKLGNLDTKKLALSRKL